MPVDSPTYVADFEAGRAVGRREERKRIAETLRALEQSTFLAYVRTGDSAHQVHANALKRLITSLEGESDQEAGSDG